MTRTQAINHLRIAGYHDDRARFARLFVENRVSKQAANHAYNEGRALKIKGVRCGCNICAPKSSRNHPETPEK